MKKLIFAMLVGMMALSAMAQGGKFTVKGTFDGVGDTVAFFFSTESAVSEMVAFKNLPFYRLRVYTGEMLEVTVKLKDVSELEIRKWVNGNISFDEKPLHTFVAIPGETLIVTKDDNGEIQMSGSQFYVDYQEALNSVEPANKAADEFIKHLRQEMDAGASEEQLMAEYQEKMPLLTQAYVGAVMDYVKAHPDQDAAAALIAELPDDVEDIEAAAALLTERARGSEAAKLYKRQLEKAKKQAEEDAKQYALEGSMAPDFTLNDINGKPLALSSLRGKWVILDFWGSWCGWCIKGMPKMKEYYAKYGDKLEILGVDCNDTQEKWKDAVAEHEIPWLHVYNDMDNDDSNNPLVVYGVQGFPTKVVVDPEGKIAKVIVGEDSAFYTFLDEVLQ